MGLKVYFLLLLGFLALLSHYADAQCAPGRYGDDCTCTSRDAVNLAVAGTTMTCSDGVWTAVGTVNIVSRTDLMYDTLIADTPSYSPYSILIPEGGNLTLHVDLQNLGNGSGVVRSGVFSSTAPISINGTVHLILDNLEQGQWVVQFATYDDGLVGTPSLGVSSNASQFTCRSFSNPETPVFRINEGTFNFNVTETNPKCGFNKGSRNWALYGYIGIASFGGLLIIFTIFTCAITPWRKAIWYPPY